MSITIRLLKSGTVCIDPETRKPIPFGRNVIVTKSTYWYRRMRDGTVELVPDTKQVSTYDDGSISADSE